ncbi:hypothetical protein V6N13_038039 [Hibiscus sabdariffa]
MDLDSAALLNADPMIVTRVEDKSQDASNSATAPATSLADPSLPSFRDMVVGRNSAGQQDSLISDLDVELSDEDVVISNTGVYPEIRFSDKIHKVIDAQLTKSLVGLPVICFGCGKYGHLEEVCGTRETSNINGAAIHSKVPSVDNRFGPWMQVVNRNCRPEVVRRALNQNDSNPAYKSGSRFGVLVDGVDQQGPMTIPTHGNSGTGNISHLHVVSNGLSTSGLQVLVLAHTNANSNGAAVGGVEPSAPGEMEIVAPMEGLNRENEQVMESTVPSCISHVEGNVVDYVLLSEPDAVETVVVPTVAAKGKVVAAPTSLPSGKHMVVQVIDESSKRVLQKHNGKAMYGRIRSTTAKGVKQNSNVAKPVARGLDGGVKWYCGGCWFLISEFHGAMDLE